MNKTAHGICELTRREMMVKLLKQLELLRSTSEKTGAEERPGVFVARGCSLPMGM